MSSNLLRRAVHQKWPEPEQKEWWYTKFTAARAAKLTRLWERQLHLCAYCKVECWRRDGGPRHRRATLDHKVPTSRGGGDSFDNLVMACDTCNSLKGDMPYDHWEVIFSDPENFKLYRSQRSKRDLEKIRSRDEAYVRRSLQLAVLFCHFPFFAHEVDVALELWRLRGDT